MKITLVIKVNVFHLPGKELLVVSMGSDHILSQEDVLIMHFTNIPVRKEFI